MELDYLLVDFKGDDSIRQDEAEQILVELTGSYQGLDFQRQNRTYKWNSDDANMRRLARRYIVSVGHDTSADVAMLIRDSLLVDAAYVEPKLRVEHASIGGNP